MHECTTIDIEDAGCHGCHELRRASEPDEGESLSRAGAGEHQPEEQGGEGAGSLLGVRARSGLRSVQTWDWGADVGMAYLRRPSREAAAYSFRPVPRRMFGDRCHCVCQKAVLCASMCAPRDLA
jgi:hypothetical protein